MSTPDTFLSNIIDFDTVVDRIKSVEGTRFDADAAKALGMDRRSLAGYKTRGTLPFEHLLQYALKNGYSLEWLLHDAGPQKVAELVRLAETPARYPRGFNFELHHNVAKEVRQLLAENDIVIDRDTTAEKVDYLIAYCYNEVNKRPEQIISKDKISGLLKLL